MVLGSLHSVPLTVVTIFVVPLSIADVGIGGLRAIVLTDCLLAALAFLLGQYCGMLARHMIANLIMLPTLILTIELLHARLLFYRIVISVHERRIVNSHEVRHVLLFKLVKL